MQNTTHQHALPPDFELLWYSIRSVLGQGGFGITYLAHDSNLDQPVAIKEYLPSAFAVRSGDGSVVPTSADADEDFNWGLQRFIEEGRTLARFDHPGIVRIHSVFEDRGTAYLVMRYEQGEPMSALLEREKTLPEKRLKLILLEIIDGLEQVHNEGFIHRDIKPANIYLRENGSAVLLDFGAARQALGMHTHAMTTIVSAGYAPFEQYYTDSTRQGPWTDIYALGATAYRAIVGRPPLPAIDRSKAIFLNGKTDSLVSASEIGRGRYSPSFLHATDRALSFREKERPRTLSEWRKLLDQTSSVDAASAAEPAAFVAATDEIERDIPTQVATIRVDVDSAEMPTEIAPIADERASPARRRRWDGKKRYLIPFVILLLLLLPREDREPPEQTEPANLVNQAAGPSAAATPGDGADNVAQLLVRALLDIDALRLTTPPDNNAWQKFRDVLAIDPDNAAAKLGLTEIVRRYVDLAADAARSNDLPQARQYLERAALVDPQSPILKRAEQRLARRVEARSDAAPIAAQDERITDKKRKRKTHALRNALSERDYGKALKLLREAGKGTK